MVKGYTAITMRMLVIAAVITMSAQLQAAHTMMSSPKRHNMSCKQLIFMALGLSAVVQGSGVHIAGFVGGRAVETNVPVCDGSKVRPDTAAATLSSLLGAEVNVQTLRSAQSVQHRVVLDNGLEGIASLCVPLHKLGKQNLDINGKPAVPQQQLVQLPAPAAQ